MLTAFIDTAAAQTAFAIGEANLNDYANKVAHALAGCAAGATRQDGGCTSGAIGAVIGELSAEVFGFDQYGNPKPAAAQMAAMLGGIGAAIAGLNASEINIAANSAANAAINNGLLHYAQKALNKLADALKAIELKPLVEKQQLIRQYLDNAAARGGLTELEISALGIIYAANETLFPTSLLDVAGPAGKAIGKTGTLIKAGKNADEAAKLVSAEIKAAEAAALAAKADAFEKSLVGISVGERIALIKQESIKLATNNGWTKDSRLTRLNDRDIYTSPNGNLYALDTQHGTWEVLSPKGIHQGEVRLIDLSLSKGADKTGGHDIRIR